MQYWGLDKSHWWPNCEAIRDSNFEPFLASPLSLNRTVLSDDATQAQLVSVCYIAIFLSVCHTLETCQYLFSQPDSIVLAFL